MKREIYILGIGNNTPVIIEIAELSGFEILGLIHYNQDLVGQTKWGYKVLMDYEQLLDMDIEQWNFALSMGDNKLRGEIANKLKRKGGNLPTLIHPTASVSRFSKLGDGVVIQANTTIQADVNIGDNTVISFASGVSHNVSIGKSTYVACHSLIGAYTTIGDNVLVGMGTTTVSGKVARIGDNVIVGAGSLVLSSIDDNKTVYGRPAK